MKALYFCNLLPRKEGALESLLVSIADGMRNGGDEIHYVFAGEPIPPVAERLRAACASWSVIPGWGDGFSARPWRFVASACRLVRLHRPDVAVVHFGNELPAFAASLLGPLVGAGGMKWVWQQDQQIADPSPLAARLNRLRLLALRFDHFVAVYQGGKASLLARGVPAARISVIHNSVSDHGPDRGRGWLRKELDLESDAVLLVGVGSLIPRKRHNLLLQVLRAAGRRTHLVIAGDGPLRQELESRVAEMGLDRRVHLLGLRNDVRDILTEADLYVSAAVAEGCNYTLLEAMATGVPAVVTESGAAREQIEDGVSGYVVGLNDVAGFACRVEALLSDADRRRAMGDAARELWARMFRIEDAASKYRELYRRLAVGDFGS